MVTYNKKIYMYIELLASFEGYGHPLFQKLFSQNFIEAMWFECMTCLIVIYVILLMKHLVFKNYVPF
jgi:hypothetical protein